MLSLAKITTKRRDEFEFLLLLKFGQKQHLEALRELGSIRLNHINYFSSLEDNKVRGDSLEGASHIIQPHDISDILFDFEHGPVRSVTVKTEDLGGPVITSYAENNYTHIFCTYAIRRPTDLFPIDKRVAEFGEHFIIISPIEFGDILKNNLKQQKIGIGGEHVEYFSEDMYSGHLTEFRKSDIYKWQSEFRFAIRAPTRDPVTLTVGNLSHITSPVLPIDALDTLNFTAAEARQRGFIWEP